VIDVVGGHETLVPRLGLDHDLAMHAQRGAIAPDVALGVEFPLASGSIGHVPCETIQPFEIDRIDQAPDVIARR
jgi:hypothetical protein